MHGEETHGDPWRPMGRYGYGKGRHGEGTHDTVWRGDGEAWRGIWGGTERRGEERRGEERRPRIPSARTSYLNLK